MSRNWLAAACQSQRTTVLSEVCEFLLTINLELQFGGLRLTNLLGSTQVTAQVTLECREPRCEQSKSGHQLPVGLLNTSMSLVAPLSGLHHGLSTDVHVSSVCLFFFLTVRIWICLPGWLSLQFWPSLSAFITLLLDYTLDLFAVNLCIKILHMDSGSSAL